MPSSQSINHIRRFLIASSNLVFRARPSGKSVLRFNSIVLGTGKTHPVGGLDFRGTKKRRLQLALSWMPAEFYVIDSKLTPELQASQRSGQPLVNC